ncbi:MAG: hypothetical protein PHH59_08330 [Methylovulum sp.]|uniref:hypothetical protein n=1 Tax=Methylovulum sp. TaxID=1916980 RepID=UPI002632FB56|nr:hypothetical protein [Methylovulum sp.]MDD2724009.1 hypothetical protein [Methylovulum sp.]
MLLYALREQGQAISHDWLYVELPWLQQVAGVLVYQYAGGAHVAQLGNKGLDVVNDLLAIPGIRRPAPDELFRASAYKSIKISISYVI